MAWSELWNTSAVWSTIGGRKKNKEKSGIPPKPCDRIAQRGFRNTEEKVKEKTFFSHKAYLAEILHIRPPQRLSVFQQWQHCQKPQKQAVRYHCCSHGNRPAEGVPAPTLICTNSIWAQSSACYTDREGCVCPVSLFLWDAGPHTQTCYQYKRLAGPRLWKVPQGGKGSRLLRFWARGAHSHTSSP